MQVKKQYLELDTKKHTGSKSGKKGFPCGSAGKESKSGKKYVKAVHCHPAYLTYL